MSLIIPQNNGSHWYARDGTPAYTVPRADGKGYRKTTVRDARKLDLLPSVTTILQVLANPSITNYRMQSLLLSALTLPERAGESLEERAVRVLNDSTQHQRRAAGYGHDTHQAIEDFARSKVIPIRKALRQHVRAFDAWLNKHEYTIIAIEEVQVGGDYAGRVDVIVRDPEGHEIVVDIKTQEFEEKPRVYEEWSHQLAAYAGLRPPGTRIANLVFDSSGNITEPVYHLWSVIDQRKAERVFYHAKEIWKIKKAYNPANSQQTEVSAA